MKSTDRQQQSSLFDPASQEPAAPTAGERPPWEWPENRDLNFALRVLDAYRIKISHAHDKLTSLSNSRTRLLPHQIEATHHVAQALKPRFILADEVGLGKTIEAGLIMKELILRRGYEKVLVVTPAALLVQWQQEMRSKFNEEFTILNRRTFAEAMAARKKTRRLLASLDFIKNEPYAAEIHRRKWDMVVFDEAHRLRRDFVKSTRAYAFAEKITNKCDALLLLTATPFRGKLDELYHLVRLIDPHLLGPPNAFFQEFIQNMSDRSMARLKEKVSTVMLRRRKVEVGGFTKRIARTVRLELSPEERQLYDATTDYVKREYNLAVREGNRTDSFIMIVFQKLLDSSTRALLRALERRRVRLEENLYGGLSGGSGRKDPASGEEVPPAPVELDDAFDPLEYEEWYADEWGPEAVEKSRSGGGGKRSLSGAEKRGAFMTSDKPGAKETWVPRGIGHGDNSDQLKTLSEQRKEILTLSRLVKLGRAIKIDRKLAKLRETLLKLKQEGYDKFVIFTQFKTTMEYLAEHLGEDFTVTVFHGSLSLNEKEAAVEEFKKKTEIFLCTEAGGEGRNLQFSSVLVNYDLPWSPLKIEQRIGRIHRFGQKRDCLILNLSTRDTVAERVLEVLETKIKLFEESIGPSDTLLGAVEDGLDFTGMMMQFAAGQKKKKEMDAEIGEQMQLAERGYQKLNELLTPRCVDFNLHDYYNHTGDDRSIDNRNIENFTLQYLAGAVDEHFRLQKKLVGASGTANGPEYLLEDLQAGGSPRPATFQSEVALGDDRVDFLALGHPVVNRALDHFLESRDRKSIQTVARTAAGTGLYFVMLARYPKARREELLSCLVSDDRRKSPLLPEELLLDLGASPRPPAGLAPPLSAETLRTAYETARERIRGLAEGRARDLTESLHRQFKGEEYKLEISFRKKIRLLEEKRDRQKLRYSQNPKRELRAVITRIENELIQAETELHYHLTRVRQSGRIEPELELLQIYRFV